jgi:hypothetical protein
VRYAERADLEPWADFYDVTLPDALDRLLDLASGDVTRFLGAEYDPALLDADDAAALGRATCVQAVFRAGQGVDAALGLDDGIASVGGVAFSLRNPPRLSPEAAEQLVGRGLIARTGTAAPDAIS